MSLLAPPPPPPHTESDLIMVDPSTRKHQSLSLFSVSTLTKYLWGSVRCHGISLRVHLFGGVVTHNLHWQFPTNLHTIETKTRCFLCKHSFKASSFLTSLMLINPFYNWNSMLVVGIFIFQKIISLWLMSHNLQGMACIIIFHGLWFSLPHSPWEILPSNYRAWREASYTSLHWPDQ